MTVRDLKEFLADKPEHYDVGIEAVIGEEHEFIRLEGPSEKRWEFSIALLTEPQCPNYVKLV